MSTDRSVQAATKMSVRLILAAGLMTTLVAAAPEKTPRWQAHVDATASQFLTLPVGNEVLPTVALTPTPFYESMQNSPLNSLPQGFWQDLSVSLLALFGLVSTGLLMISWVRHRAIRKVAYAGARQKIALHEEGPARICRNPVPALDAVIMSDDWPTMVSIGTHDGSGAVRRMNSADDVAELAAMVMASYRFYALNAWGVVDSGTGGRFESDAAAFAHARRIADNGAIEVWRNGTKLMTINAKLDEGFACSARSLFA